MSLDDVLVKLSDAEKLVVVVSGQFPGKPSILLEQVVRLVREAREGVQAHLTAQAKAGKAKG